MSTSAIIETAPFDKKAAKAEIQIAWENHKRNGMEFGRVCYEWTQRVAKSKGGHGSAGRGLSEILRVLGIDRYVFDYWLKKYECSIGGGIPCPDCPLTFPSKAKMKAHLHKAHPYFPDDTSDERAPEPSIGYPPDFDADMARLRPSPAGALNNALNSEPELPIVSTSAWLGATLPDKDREQLVYFVERLERISEALQQVADNNAKWSKFEEYKEVVSLGKKIAKLVELL